MVYCKDCGEEYIGDGYTMVMHCPNAEEFWDYEPDADPVDCGGLDD